MTIPQFSAMLALLSDGLPTNSENFVVEEKFDGMRGLLVMHQVSGERAGVELVNFAEIWNRHGENKGRLNNAPALRKSANDLGDALPELWKGTVLDGELVARSDTHLQTWNRTMHLLGSAGQSEGGLQFVVFDLPYLMGANIMEKPWTERRELLETLFQVIPADSVIKLSALIPATQEKLKEIWASGGEGVIVKQKSAAYHPGGRHHWLKIKAEWEADGVIMDFTPGQGKYSDTFGAVVVGQYRDGKLVRVTQFSGMTDTVRRKFNPATDVGKVVEFTHKGQTEGSYRHPQWSRWREDKKPTDCTWEASTPVHANA